VEKLLWLFIVIADERQNLARRLRIGKLATKLKFAEIQVSK